MCVVSGALCGDVQICTFNLPLLVHLALSMSACRGLDHGGFPACVLADILMMWFVLALDQVAIHMMHIRDTYSAEFMYIYKCKLHTLHIHICSSKI